VRCGGSKKKMERNLREKKKEGGNSQTLNKQG